ncbi:MAG: M48 family metallopeptidase [Lautropia sp.]
MQAQHFSLLLIAFLAASIGVRLWLAARQYRHVALHQASVPAAFADRIPLQSHQRAAAYTRAKLRLGVVDLLASALLLLGLTLGGGLQWLIEAWGQWLPGSPLLAQTGIVMSVVLVSSMLELPFEIYRQFVQEARFGFNRMTVSLFVADLLKSTALGVVLGLPLLLAVLWLMREAGERWWLWVWAVWTAFNVAVLVVYPTWIAPLFNRFTPLEAGTVRARVEALLARCGFSSDGLFVMDGSRRSAHGNAYFTGFGKGKRIVFFDTLLARLDVDELEAVLAHELGHFRKRHVARRVAVSFAASLAGLALLGWLATQRWFYEGLGVSGAASAVDAPGVTLVLFFLAMPVFGFGLRPLTAWLSRRDEFEADAFAADHADAQRLADALVKLYEDNASTLTPDPLHSAFYDSHPPAAIRVGRLRRLADAGRRTGAGLSAA